jgi:uncharacterized damage-inducible protein DinB
MNREIQSIIRNIEVTLSGEPWFGRSIYELLAEIDVSKVFIKPNHSEHSLIDLLYHMNTWAEFTLRRIQDDKEQDMAVFEKLDWREIQPGSLSWENGVAEFKSIHERIIAELQTKNDDFLKENVDYRKYNFRFLLNGLIQHNIYHVGQIAYLRKLLR